MIGKVVLGALLLVTEICAASVPSDLTVNAFTVRITDKAVQQALAAKSAKQTKKPVQPFATEELLKALTAMAAVRNRDQCAIPLREVKGGNGQIMDPLAKPAGKLKFDDIAKPAPIGPCYFNVSSAH